MRTTAALLTALLLAGCPTEDTPPDDPPADDALATAELAGALATQWMTDQPAGDMYWDWMDAVYMMGFVRIAERGGDPTVLDYPATWVDHYYADIADRYPDASDRVAPNMVAVELMRLTGEPSYALIPPQVDDYLATAPRSSDGGILHWGTQFPDREELLIDSLFMFGGYLVAMYDLTGDEAYLDLFVEQVAIFADLCRDPDEGLFLHAWDDADGVTVPAEPVFWGRGNGWIVAVGAWYLSVAPADHAGRDTVAPIHRDLVDAFVRYQDESGLFYTVLNMPDEPDNYLETSCTALFAAGVARGIRCGALDEETYRPALAAAVDGVQSMITTEDDGHLTVADTSFGTVPTSYENYVGIPLVDDLAMGVGTVMMALAEADGL